MPQISDVDEFTRDWDWFAVDPSGAIGHFTSAGRRRLPISVKADNEAALRLIDYFDSAPKKSEYVVTVEAELDLKNGKNREWYLRSFVAMAAVGLFSYNTYVDRPSTEYFLVARPKSPLRVNDVPLEVGELLRRTHSVRFFADSLCFREDETHNW
jgi:hypothetical protein